MPGVVRTNSIEIPNSNLKSKQMIFQQLEFRQHMNEATLRQKNPQMEQSQAKPDHVRNFHPKSFVGSGRASLVNKGILMKKNSQKTLFQNNTESAQDIMMRSATNKQEQSIEGIEMPEDDLMEKIQDNEEEIGPIDDDVEEDFDQGKNEAQITSEAKQLTTER